MYIGTGWHMLGLFQSTSWARWLVFIGIFQFQLRAWPFVASTREKLHLAEKNRPFEMDPSTSVRRPLQDVTNGCVPLPLGLPCAMAQPCLSPSPLAMPQAAVVAHLEPHHQQTAALSTAVVSVQAQSATGAWQREGLSSAAVVDALQG